MSIKLFVTDLDGTLLPSGQKVSAKNIEAVQKLVKAGVTVTIATGRMYQATLPIALSLGVNVPIITYNGALIKTVEGEIIHENFIAPETVLSLMEFAEKRNWHLQTYSDDKLYYAEENKYSKEYEAAVKVKGDAIGWQALKNYKNGVPKLLVITDNLEQTNERVGILNTEFADKVDAFSSNPNYIEITAKGVSKAAAIDILAGKLKISKLETLAIGDSYNDLPMLKAAGVSVAMGNAPDNIKEVCTYVTESCEADGFAKFIIQNFEFLTK